MFQNPSQAEIEKLLRSTRVIAMVGLSADPSKPSYTVAQHLKEFGYRVIPVTPTATEVLGERAAPDLDHVKDLLKPGEQVDLVDVFRRSEFVAGIVDDCIRLKFPAIWLQLGVVDEAAATRAQAAGLFTVMDRCVYRERRAIG